MKNVQHFFGIILTKVRIEVLRSRIKWNFLLHKRSTRKSSEMLVQVLELEMKLSLKQLYRISE